MIFMIIYLLGCLYSLYLLKDIFSRQNCSVWRKLALSLYVVIFSWIGSFSYSLAISFFLDRSGRTVREPKVKNPEKQVEAKPEA